MARTRRARKPFDPHRWTQVHTRMRCTLGDHDVYAGAWMRFRKDDFRQMGSCEDCLQGRGITRPRTLPARPFTFTRKRATDVKARQVGDE